MPALPPVVATLLADTKQFSAEMTKAEATMGRFGASSASAGARAAAFANKASTAIIGAGVVVGITALKMAGNYQQLVTAIQTGAGESAKNIGLITKGMQDMAGSVGQTPAELARGLYMIESAGYHGAQGLTVLKSAAQGAAVGSADMQTVASALTTVLHDYSLPVKDANSVTSALVETVASGKTHLQDLSTSLGKVIPVAASLGITFPQVAAAMAVQTNAGLSARFAASHLSTALLGLVAPSSKSIKVLNAVGLTTTDVKNALADPRKGLGYALTMIEDHIARQVPRGSANYVMALKDALGTTTAYQLAVMLTGKHLKEFNTDVGNIGRRMDSVKPQVQGFAAVQKDLNFQLKSLKASGESALISAGDWLLPKATAVARWANSLFSYFKEHPLVAKIASDTAIGLFAASVAYKLTKAMVGVWNSVKSLFAPAETAAQTATLMTPLEAIAANTAALVELQGGTAVRTGAVVAGAGAAEAGVAGAEVVGGMTIAGAALAAAGVVLPLAAAYALLHFTAPTGPGWKPASTGVPGSSGGPRGIPMTWTGTKWVPTYSFSGGHQTVTSSGTGPRGGKTHVTVRIR